VHPLRTLSIPNKSHPISHICRLSRRSHRSSRSTILTAVGMAASTDPVTRCTAGMPTRAIPAAAPRYTQIGLIDIKLPPQNQTTNRKHTQHTSILHFKMHLLCSRNLFSGCCGATHTKQSMPTKYLVSAYLYVSYIYISWTAKKKPTNNYNTTDHKNRKIQNIE